MPRKGDVGGILMNGDRERCVASGMNARQLPLRDEAMYPMESKLYAANVVRNIGSRDVCSALNGTPAFHGKSTG